MNRSRSAKAFVPVTAALVVLLSACSGAPEPERAGRGTTTDPDTSYEGPLFEPVRSRLPGGVRVLSRSEPHLHVKVPAGRYAVRLSRSWFWTAALPDHGMVYAGTQATLPPGSDGQVSASIAPRRGTALPVDPCRNHELRLVGPSTRALATALSRQPFLRSTDAARARVGGARGYFVKLVVPDLYDVSGCADGRVDLFTAAPYLDPNGTTSYGRVYRLWVLDVGGRRVVLQAEQGTKARHRDVASLQALVDSISFVQAPAPG